MLPHSSKILLLCICRTIGSPSGGKSSPSCADMAAGVWDSQLAQGLSGFSSVLGSAGLGSPHPSQKDAQPPSFVSGSVRGWR